MAFKLKRQLRYNGLRKDGFTRFEAQEFSKVITAHAPWLREMRVERRAKLRVFLRTRGNTRKKFETEVRREYGEKEWTKPIRFFGIMRRAIDPWKWYRQKRDEYVKDHPSWISPGSNRKPKRPKSPTAQDMRAIARRMGGKADRDEMIARGMV